MPDTEQLRVIAADIAETVSIALDQTVVHDRFAGTAVLTNQQATDLGTLGYVARASGLDDERTDCDATATGTGVGIVEGWRGAITHRIELRPDGTLGRVKIVDPSFFNWPASPSPSPTRSSPTSHLPTKASTSPYAGNDL